MEPHLIFHVTLHWLLAKGGVGQELVYSFFDLYIIYTTLPGMIISIGIGPRFELHVLVAHYCIVFPVRKMWLGSIRVPTRGMT